MGAGGFGKLPRWACNLGFVLLSAAVVTAAVPATIAGAVLGVVALLALATPWVWPGHGESMDMGTMSDTFRHDVLTHLGRYTIASTIASVAIAFAVGALWPLLFILVGATPALAYVLALKLWKPEWNVERYFDGWTSVAEFASAFFWYGLAALIFI